MRPATLLLRPGPSQLAAMTAALGHGYAHDAEGDRFAHPAARYAIAPDRRMRSVLPAIGSPVDELRAAVTMMALASGLTVAFLRERGRT